MQPGPVVTPRFPLANEGCLKAPEKCMSQGASPLPGEALGLLPAGGGRSESCRLEPGLSRISGSAAPARPDEGTAREAGCGSPWGRPGVR